MKKGEVLEFRPRTKSFSASSQADTPQLTIPKEDRNKDWFTKPEERMFHGVTIPTLHDIYDVSQVKIFGISADEFLSQAGTDRADSSFTELIETQLFWGRMVCISHDVTDRTSRDNALRYLAEYTWDVAGQMQSDTLKEKIAQMLQHAFGVGRAGKILERLSTISNIDKAKKEVICDIPQVSKKREGIAARKGFRVIK